MATATQPMPNAQLVPISAIKPASFNPRRTFDAAELSQLAQSIKAKGVIEPIVLRPAGKGHFELVAGERRWRAASEAGLTEIPAVVREDLDDAAAEEIALVENLQRQDLAPLEEAESYSRLLKKQPNLTQADLAAKVGKSPAYVSQRLSLTLLPKAAKEALGDGRLQLRAALLLTRVPAKLQAQALEQLLHDVRMGRDPLGFREATRIVLSYMVKLEAAPFDTKDDTLLPAAGACTNCPKSSAAENHRDLFGGTQPAHDAVCLDRPCFQAKADAHWQRAQDRAAQQGAHVIPDKQAKNLFSGSRLIDSQERVDLDTVCHDDPKRRTWRQLLRTTDNLPRAIARDDHGAVHELMPRTEALKAAKDRGHGFAHEAQTHSRTRDRQAQEERAERQKRDLLRATAEAATTAVLVNVKKKDHGSTFWRFIVQALAAGSWHDAIMATVRRRGWTVKGEHVTATLMRQTAKLDTADLRALAVELLLGRQAIRPYNTDSPFSGTLRSACKAFGVDLGRLHKQAKTGRAKKPTTPTPTKTKR